MVNSGSSMTTAQNFYDRSVAISEDAFMAGYFDIAYHALETAFSCAEIIEDDQYLSTVSKIAKRQLTHIDEHYPNYKHSTLSSKKRQKDSIFLRLVYRAEKQVDLRDIDRKIHQIKYGRL